MEPTSEVDSISPLAPHGKHGFADRGKPCPYRGGTGTGVAYARQHFANTLLV